MRFIIFGAGAVGSVIGGRIFQRTHGHDVVLVARGAHRQAIANDGLTINDPIGTVVLDIPVVETIEDAAPGAGDVVILSMKTQDTEPALDRLAACAPPGIVVACAQNGVENERLALRRFADVYGICVILPATFIEPGVVDANGTPHNAILDIGRYPRGTDATAQAIADVFVTSGLPSRATPDVMAAKYAKLLLNLGNVVDALAADPKETVGLVQRAKEEAIACYRAAGISWTSDDDERARRAGVMEMRPIDGRRRGGGSTWQSFVRGATTTEVDWLNGEIVLLGRLHGVPTPVNVMLCEITREALASGAAPRSFATDELLARVRV